MRLDWHRIANVNARNLHGTVHNFQATLHLKEGANPKFVPFAIRGAVGKELDTLEAAGNMESHMGSTYRCGPICGDYKVTINPVLEIDQHL